MWDARKRKLKKLSQIYFEMSLKLGAIQMDQAMILSQFWFISYTQLLSPVSDSQCCVIWTQRSFLWFVSNGLGEITVVKRHRQLMKEWVEKAEKVILLLFLLHSGYIHHK